MSQNIVMYQTEIYIDVSSTYVSTNEGWYWTLRTTMPLLHLQFYCRWDVVGACARDRGRSWSRMYTEVISHQQNLVSVVGLLNKYSLGRMIVSQHTFEGKFSYCRGLVTYKYRIAWGRVYHFEEFRSLFDKNSMITSLSLTFLNKSIGKEEIVMFLCSQNSWCFPIFLTFIFCKNID